METQAVQLMAAEELMSRCLVGSTDWTWEQEAADLDSHPCPCCGTPGHYQLSLQEDIARHGIRLPVLVGSDGRLWDGHHRVVAAMRLGIPVPVVFA